MTKPFPFTRLTPEEAKAQYPALFATFKAEFSWSGLSLSGNYDKMIAAMVSIAVVGLCPVCHNAIRDECTCEFTDYPYGADE